MKVFIYDGLDIREITDKELKQTFLKLKEGDSFEIGHDDDIKKYEVICVALDYYKDILIIADEI